MCLAPDPPYREVLEKLRAMVEAPLGRDGAPPYSWIGPIGGLFLAVVGNVSSER